jgi:hypothetical protein
MVKVLLGRGERMSRGLVITLCLGFDVIWAMGFDTTGLIGRRYTSMPEASAIASEV